jgi:hypothetical protein
MSSVRPLSTFPLLPPERAAARVTILGRSIVVALADDAHRAQVGLPPVLSADEFAAVAREAAHYAAPLLDRPYRWCGCGDPLVSARDRVTGSCRWCRADEAERMAVVRAEPGFAAEVLS